MDKNARDKTRLPAALLTVAAFIVATLLWLPSVHLFYLRSAEAFRAPSGLSSKSRELLARHAKVWSDSRENAREIGRLRASNEEWDFMGRTFLVLSLANIALREPAQLDFCLDRIDQIIQLTLLQDQKNGPFVFLLPYAKARNFVVQPARSLFVDSEISMMIGARRILRESPVWQHEMAGRNEHILASVGANRIMAAESYPNECWMFDHAAAMAALKMQDALDGTDHSQFCREWLTSAREHLTHPQTGLLVSCYDLDGHPIDGPEGSTIWLVAHCLQLVDPQFAADQYSRARRELGLSCLGFAYAREWPTSWRGAQDIDSGPVIPILDISAGASGMAFLGASAFDDFDYLAGLAATLDMAGFPQRVEGRLKYCASNQVGDAVVLYASVMGPMWERIQKAGRR
jgi:hypothetical protein